LRQRPADGNIIAQQVEAGEGRLPGKRAGGEIARGVAAADGNGGGVDGIHHRLRNLQRPCPAGEANAGAGGIGREGDGAGGLDSRSGGVNNSIRIDSNIASVGGAADFAGTAVIIEAGTAWGCGIDGNVARSG